jgi:hypothetical protein
MKAEQIETRDYSDAPYGASMQAASWQRRAFALQQIAIIRQVLSIVNKYLVNFDKDT